MSSICSFCTGHTSMQAPQVVQAHAASGDSAKLSSGRGLSAPASNPGRCFARWFSSIRLLISSAAGLKDFPVTAAGQTSWQRLHWMQAYASSSRGQPRSSSLFAPSFCSSDSRFSSSAGSTPDEELRATRYLAGAIKIWMCFVNGKYIKNKRTLPSAPQ